MGAAIALVGMGALAIWAFVYHSKQRAKRQTTLQELAKWLAGSSDTNSARGTLAGTPVTIAYVSRGSGSSRESWTEVDAELPAKYPLTLFIRPHAWRDAGKIERGEMVDVAVGDAAFDERFLVEAAPADVARMLFDDVTRRFLMDTKVYVTVTTETGAKPYIRLAVRKWLDTLSEATPAIEVATSLARRVRNAYAELEAKTAPQETGSPYRPVLDDRGAREAADARQREVVDLDRIRAERAARERMVAILIVVAFVVLVIVSMLR